VENIQAYYDTVTAMGAKSVIVQARGQHSSLFCRSVNDKEKNLTPDCRHTTSGSTHKKNLVVVSLTFIFCLF